MPAPLLYCKKLTRVLPAEVPVTVVNGAEVALSSGECVAITGPSGSGKSSLLYLLGLLDHPTSGEVWFNDENMTLATEARRAQVRLSSMGFVFQFHFLLPEFTALENVMLPMQRLGILSEDKIRARAEELLTQLGLGTQMHKFPKQLSGGQSQRVSIARALANKPRLLLADEPTGNLDTVSGKVVQDILIELAHKEDCAVVVVTHDLAFAERADRGIYIVDGVIKPPLTHDKKRKK